jgi:hypothetical protein
VNPPLKLTMQDADAVPSAVEMTGPQTFQKPGTNIVAQIQPKSFGEFQGLERSDLFVLYLIRDAYPERPFFFSRTTGGYADAMGFSPYLVTTGLARKLLPQVAPSGNGLVNVEGEGMFDLPTTRTLWETTFKAPASIARRKLWVDRPSAGIPFLYLRTGAVLAVALDRAGLRAEAERLRAQTQQIAKATQLESLLAAR